jgi:hypothetical protein
MDFYEMEMAEKRKALGNSRPLPPERDPMVTVAYDRRTETKPLISFLVPVYNERRYVQSTLTKLSAVPLSKEIIIVDDGSTDGSRGALSENPMDGAVLLLHTKNQGKGGALRTALTKATGRLRRGARRRPRIRPNRLCGPLKIRPPEQRQGGFWVSVPQTQPTDLLAVSFGQQTLNRLDQSSCASHYTDAYTGCKLMATNVWRELGLGLDGF